MTYIELYAKLLSNKMIEPVQYLTPLQPPYPRWFVENTTCAYHSGAKGHSIENCIRLKEVVQGIINEGRLTFDAPPSVGTNPLPNHGGNTVNTIDDGAVHVKRKVEEIITPMKVVYQALLKAQMITPLKCEGHEIQCCTEFQGKL